MSEATEVRPVPRWVHVWAVLTVVATVPLLVLGGLVTTRRVGMADPVWPTEPWFLFFASWKEPRPGYLIEHSHRFAGFTVGAVVIVLAMAMWWTERRARLRWVGIAAITFLVGAYGQFHREMKKLVDSNNIRLPDSTGILVAAAVAVLAIGLAGLRGGRRGSALRLATLVVLIAVMAQGLLGGFRVALNALAGTDLATVHGCLAQVVFSIMVGIAFLTARSTVATNWPEESRTRLHGAATILVLLVFMQLVWGAIIRHNPTMLSQRLHLFTAFAVVAAAVWLIFSTQAVAGASERLRVSNSLLGMFLVVQVVLGIEAWLGKFTGGVLYDLQVPTTGQIIVRTSHVLIGTGIFATSVVLWLQTRETSPRLESERRAEEASRAAGELVVSGKE